MLTKKISAYYQREMQYLRERGKRFAGEYPKIGRRLGLSAGQTEDPHVSRLIDAFALLSARIHQRLDEDMPELSRTLLDILAPQLQRALPSSCIVQFNTDYKKSGLTTSQLVPAKLPLVATTPGGERCQFRTVGTGQLTPASVNAAALHYDDNEWVLTLTLNCWPGTNIKLTSLKFWLDGPAQLVNMLYMMLCSQVKNCTVLTASSETHFHAGDIRAAGFAPDDRLLGQDHGLSEASLLLMEYFVFPQKFFFVELPLAADQISGEEDNITWVIRFTSPPQIQSLGHIARLVTATTFRLNCVCAVNLFSQRSEPVTTYAHMSEYPVNPDIRHNKCIDVWSVDRAVLMSQRGNETVHLTIQPLYDIEGFAQDAVENLYWQAIRREVVTSNRIKQKFFIALSDRRNQEVNAEGETIVLELTCTNNELPGLLQSGAPDGDFENPLPLAGVYVNALTRPTTPVQPQQEKENQWTLISQISLDYVLLSGPNGAEVLRRTLSLYNINDDYRVNHLISLISEVNVRPVTQRLERSDPFSLAKGMEIAICFKDDALLCDELFLFCQVLDQFLSFYAPVNSFTRLLTKVHNREETKHHWPVRAGRQSWL